MKLDVTALRDAIRALEKSVAYLRSDLARDRDLRDQFRAASILGFELTYEVAYKMIKRQLEQIAAKAEEIVGVLDGFLADARFLLDELERRNRVAD